MSFARAMAGTFSWVHPRFGGRLTGIAGVSPAACAVGQKQPETRPHFESHPFSCMKRRLRYAREWLFAARSSLQVPWCVKEALDLRENLSREQVSEEIPVEY